MYIQICIFIYANYKIYLSQMMEVKMNSSLLKYHEQNELNMEYQENQVIVY